VLHKAYKGGAPDNISTRGVTGCDSLLSLNDPRPATFTY